MIRVTIRTAALNKEYVLAGVPRVGEFIEMQPGTATLEYLEVLRVVWEVMPTDYYSEGEDDVALEQANLRDMYLASARVALWCQPVTFKA